MWSLGVCLPGHPGTTEREEMKPINGTRVYLSKKEFAALLSLLYVIPPESITNIPELVSSLNAARQKLLRSFTRRFGTEARNHFLKIASGEINK